MHIMTNFEQFYAFFIVCTAKFIFHLFACEGKYLEEIHGFYCYVKKLFFRGPAFTS